MALIDMMNIKKNNLKIIPCKFTLGEGLLVNEDMSCWVDINKKKLAIYQNDHLKLIKLKFIPSIVIKQDRNKVTLCSDSGIYQYEIKENLFQKITNSVPWNIEKYRTNDGGYCRGKFIIGTMHKINPERHKGSLYYLNNENNFCNLNTNIHIPNTFIELDLGTILISDSLKGEIWKYSFDKKMNITKKKLWHKFESDVAPDGGCMIKDKIYIALWDASKIIIFSKEGKIIDELHLPVKRPTNCKHDIKYNRLWVTSASDGMSKLELKQYPDSGNTLIFDLN